MFRKSLLFFFPLILFSLTWVYPAGHAVAATSNPTDQLRPFLKKVTDRLADPEMKHLAKREKLQRMIEIARERFDFREMSKRVLGQQWRKLDNSQQQEFEQLFTQLLQYAYVDKIDDYSGQEVTFVGERVQGDRAEVQTQLIDQQRVIPISYILILRDDQWMLYDVVVEGVSLIRNYLEQFSEIIRKEGYAGLRQQMQEKISQLEKEKISS